MRKNDLGVVGPPRTWRIRRDVRSVRDTPADLFKPVEGQFLNVGFVDLSHVVIGLVVNLFNLMRRKVRGCGNLGDWL